MPLALKKSSYWRILRSLCSRRDAVDRHFGLIDCERAAHAQLRTHLVHQKEGRIEAEVPQGLDHPSGLDAAMRRREFPELCIDGPGRRVGKLRPDRQMAVFERVVTALLLSHFGEVHRLYVIRSR